MEHSKIKMIGGPFVGNVYEKYTGKRETINRGDICCSVELIPGDYYYGLFGIMRSRPGAMSAKYLEENPNLWIPFEEPTY